MPAYLKAFLEQVFRPEFAAVKSAEGKPWKNVSQEKACE
ncbi:hypothetical protein [Methylotuvimicrobium alcaliphilum]|nr:hypothetical protein [Methylotuvimicrobium alcaliphilum]